MRASHNDVNRFMVRANSTQTHPLLESYKLYLYLDRMLTLLCFITFFLSIIARPFMRFPYPRFSVYCFCLFHSHHLKL